MSRVDFHKQIDWDMISNTYNNMIASGKSVKEAKRYISSEYFGSPE